MENELYPELIEYIFNQCKDFYSEKELKASEHLVVSEMTRNSNDLKAIRLNEEYLTNDKEALKLLEGGYDNFKIKTATRIYTQHKDELDLNLCPKCGKIARLPESKQCRFCFYDWH